jgi:beclin 1
LQKRKKLLRCAELLKEAFLAYREIFFNLHLTSITFRDRTLFLNQKPYSQTDRYERFDFPDHLTPNPEHKEAALMDNQSIAASILLGPLVNKLLKGMNHIETSTV